MSTSGKLERGSAAHRPYMRKTRQMAAHLKHQLSMVWPLSPRRSLPMESTDPAPPQTGESVSPHRHGLWKSAAAHAWQDYVAKPMRYTSQSQSRDPHHPLIPATSLTQNTAMATIEI